MKQTIISVIGPSGCGKSQYINPIAKRLCHNGYTVDVPHLIERDFQKFLRTLNNEAQFVILQVGADLSKPSNMRIEFHDKFGPMELIRALHRERPQPAPAPAIPTDDDMNEPLGKACGIDNPDCESCQ